MVWSQKNKNVLELPKNHFKDVKKVADFPYAANILLLSRLVLPVLYVILSMKHSYISLSVSRSRVSILRLQSRLSLTPKKIHFVFLLILYSMSQKYNKRCACPQQYKFKFFEYVNFILYQLHHWGRWRRNCCFKFGNIIFVDNI